MEIAQLQNAFVRVKQAQAMLGNVSRASIYRWVADGTLPPLVKIGPKVSGFVRTELEDSITAKIAARRSA